MNFAKLKVALFLILFMFLASAASAQTSPDARSLTNKINQLERQLDTLNRAFYGEGKAPKNLDEEGTSTGGAPVSSSSLAEFDERLNGIEQTNKDIVNKLEKLGYDLSMLQDDFKKMKTDTEQRFQESSSSASSEAATEVAAEDETAEDTTTTEGETPAASLPGGKTDGKAEVMYEKAFAKIKDSDYAGAQEGFKEFIGKYPDNSLTPNAFYWLGETYYVAADYKSAAKSFAKCFQKYPDSSKAPDSLLKLGLSLAAMGNTKDACLSLDQLKKQTKNADSPVMKRAEEEFKKLKCE